MPHANPRVGNVYLTVTLILCNCFMTYQHKLSRNSPISVSSTSASAPVAENSSCSKFHCRISWATAKENKKQTWPPSQHADFTRRCRNVRISSESWCREAAQAGRRTARLLMKTKNWADSPNPFRDSSNRRMIWWCPWHRPRMFLLPVCSEIANLST